MGFLFTIMAAGIAMSIVGLYISVISRQSFGMPMLLVGVLLSVIGAGIGKLMELSLMTALGFFTVGIIIFLYLIKK